MKLTNIKFFFAAVTATLFSSQAAYAMSLQAENSTSIDAQDGKAIIFVYQENPELSPLGNSLVIDNESIGYTQPNTFVKKVVAPGKLEILSRSENIASLEINAQANETYYVRNDITPGAFLSRSDLTVVDAKTAQKAIDMSEYLN